MNYWFLSALRGKKLRELVRNAGYTYVYKNNWPPRAFFPGDLVVNWGVSRRLDRPFQMVNNTVAVRDATNKLRALKIWDEAGLPTIPFTNQFDEAAQWLKNGNTVFERRTHGMKGHDIVISGDPDEELCLADWYSKFIPKAREYRVHVWGDQYLISQKKRKRGVESDPYIKNYQTGWIYAFKDVRENLNIIPLAFKAVHSLGLCFGAVDILTKGDVNCYLLEVNTAPGVFGVSSTKFYTDMLAKSKP